MMSMFEMTEELSEDPNPGEVCHKCENMMREQLRERVKLLTSTAIKGKLWKADADSESSWWRKSDNWKLWKYLKEKKMSRFVEKDWDEPARQLKKRVMDKIDEVWQQLTVIAAMRMSIPAEIDPGA